MDKFRVILKGFKDDSPDGQVQFYEKFAKSYKTTPENARDLISQKQGVLYVCDDVSSAERGKAFLESIGGVAQVRAEAAAPPPIQDPSSVSSSEHPPSPSHPSPSAGTHRPCPKCGQTISTGRDQCPNCHIFISKYELMIAHGASRSSQPDGVVDAAGDKVESPGRPLNTNVIVTAICVALLIGAVAIGLTYNVLRKLHPGKDGLASITLFDNQTAKTSSPELPGNDSMDSADEYSKEDEYEDENEAEYEKEDKAEYEEEEEYRVHQEFSLAPIHVSGKSVTVYGWLMSGDVVDKEEIKVAVLASWCPYCKRYLAKLGAYRKGRRPVDFIVFYENEVERYLDKLENGGNISSEQREMIEEKFDGQGQLLIDPRMLSYFNLDYYFIDSYQFDDVVTGYPSLLACDPDGCRKIRRR